MMSDSVNQEAKAAWEANADFWDQKMGEGNDFHKTLIEPSQIRLLNLKPGQRVLDLACGNGQFTRKMVSLGASVVAADGSPGMIDNAKRRTRPDEQIEYHVVDCTEESDLKSLGDGFDAAVCTMALMDIAEVQAIARTLPSLLKPNGKFVFSVQHPCFNYVFSRHGIERHDEGNKVVTECYVRATRYIAPVTVKGIAMDGQPELHFYFHRPLHDLLKPFFNTGFVLDGLEEPVFPSESDGLFQQVYSQIPAALVARLRPTPCGEEHRG